MCDIHGRIAQRTDVGNDLIVEPSDADALHADLVSGFFHPPRIIVCGFEGTVDDEITIVSHVELWPWRTIVRGSFTQSGSVVSNESLKGLEDRARQRAWFEQWSLADDVGTEYHQNGASRGGDGFCSDVHVECRTPVPAEATRLSIMAPRGHLIEVAL